MSKITLVEQGSDPATPSAGQVVIYAKTDDLLYWKDDGGVSHLVAAPNGFAAGTQTATSGTVVMSNSNGISFGMSGSTQITASIDAVRAVSAGSSSGAVSQIVFSDSNGMQWGLSGSTLTVKEINVSMFENMVGGPQQLNSAATNSGAINMSLQRVIVMKPITATQIDILAHLTVAASTNCSTTMRWAFYTMSGSTANILGASKSMSISMTSGTNSTTNSVYGANSGTRWRSLTMASVAITPGEYLVGFINSVNGPAGTTGSMSIAGGSNFSILPLPGATAQSAYFEGGIYSAASGAFPSSIHLSDILQTAAAAMAQPYFRLLGTF
jgi:hypothetical protein